MNGGEIYQDETRDEKEKKPKNLWPMSTVNC